MKLTTHLPLVPMSKNACNYTSTPQYVFMVRYLVKHRDYTFTFLGKQWNDMVIKAQLAYEETELDIRVNWGCVKVTHCAKNSMG